MKELFFKTNIYNFMIFIAKKVESKGGVSCDPLDRIDRISLDFGMHDWSAELSERLHLLLPLYAINSSVNNC